MGYIIMSYYISKYQHNAIVMVFSNVGNIHTKAELFVLFLFRYSSNHMSSMVSLIVQSFDSVA